MQSAHGQGRLERVPSDDAGFLKALDEAGLPRGELAASSSIYVALVDERGAALGYCGYELRDNALVFIRSCVVHRAHRGNGVGRTMVGGLIEMLAAEGMRELYLFTVDADPFFAKLGFEVVARETAPYAIRASSQFTMECCADAVLMRRKL